MRLLVELRMHGFGFDAFFTQNLGQIMLFTLVGINIWNSSASIHLLVASLSSVLCFTQVDRKSSGYSAADKREFISVGTAPIGGAFHTLGSAICEVVNENRGELNWQVNAESTGVSLENIRGLSRNKLQFARSNSSTTYFTVRGSEDWEQTHEVQFAMTLFLNHAEAKEKLIAGHSFFEAVVTPSGNYIGIDIRYDGLSLGSTRLITYQSVDEQTIDEFVKMVYEQRANLAVRHREPLIIRPKTVAVRNGIIYHPGATRYYREAGVWPEAVSQ